MSNLQINHLAIIPDGNRRWAKQHGLSSEDSVYKKGSETTFEIIKAAFEIGVPHVTFWASSYDNLLKRPAMLVNAIEAIFAQKFHELATHPLIHQHQVQVKVMGEWREILKPKTIAAIEESLSATAHYTERQLTVLIGYDGQRERGAALQSLQNSDEQLDKDLFKAAEHLRRHSWTGDLPNVDLILRTGSWIDPHNSAGFLSLIADNAQYAFPEVLWPDMSAELLETIINDFERRERRLGR
ncbi:MAG TPA: undecaprenyl diphosphate synthase family protein [Verrucomicrobiae bacterium]|nr:undecaprenyl diphosphate synthase family protein [Verrucomicrobiae bacterium]